MEYCYKYPRPSMSVDIMVFIKSHQAIEVLLITRKNPPFQNSFALPGGFMDIDETLHQAAVRELKEECNIEIDSLQQFRVYDEPERDPRGRTLSVIFYAILDKKPKHLKAGDDALQVKWFRLNALPKLAFDHAKILQDAQCLFEL